MVSADAPLKKRENGVFPTLQARQNKLTSARQNTAKGTTAATEQIGKS